MSLFEVTLDAGSVSRASLARRDTTKTQIAVIVVCVVLIVAICAGVGGWFLWRMKRKPQRVRQVQAMAKNGMRLDEAGERSPQEALMDQRSVATSVAIPSNAQPSQSHMPRGLGGVEGWLQSTQRSAPVGPQDVPAPRSAGRSADPTPPSPPPPMAAGRDAHSGTPYERPVSIHSSHAAHAAAVPHSRQSSEQGHGQAHAHSNSQSSGHNHARPLAFIKNMFGQPGQLQDIPSESGNAPRPPVHMGEEVHPFEPYGAPNRPMRSDSLVLSNSAYEIYPDASASQYGGRAGKRRESDDDRLTPLPAGRSSLAGGHGRRQSYGAQSSQGGLPLPSFYLPSEPGDSSLPGALPIGESVLASPLESRQPHLGLEVPRRAPRRPGSNFVVTNATHSDED